MLERFPWPTVSGGNLSDDPGSRSTTAASARVFAPTAMPWRQWLSSCARTQTCVGARLKATGWHAAREMPIWRCGFGLSATGSRSRLNSAVRGWSETRQQIKLQCLCAIKKLSFQRGLVFHLTLNVRGYHIDTHRINR